MFQLGVVRPAAQNVKEAVVTLVLGVSRKRWQGHWLDTQGHISMQQRWLGSRVGGAGRSKSLLWFSHEDRVKLRKV